MKQRILSSLLPFVLCLSLLLTSCGLVLPPPHPSGDPSTATSSSAAQSNESKDAASFSQTEAESSETESTSESSPEEEVAPPTYGITASHNPRKAALVHDVVAEYTMSDGATPISAFIQPYISTGNYRGQNLDRGLPLTLSYEATGPLPEGVTVQYAELLFSERSDLTNGTLHPLPTGEKEISFYNLMTGATYYYRFHVTLSNGDYFYSEDGSVEVTDTRRFLYIDNVRNVRDIGGAPSTLYGGTRIKFGMMYRGHELDGRGIGGSGQDFKATPEAIAAFRALGIKTDLDLRAIYNPVLPGVRYMNVSLNAYTGAFADNAAQSYGVILKSLADPENFPYYTHCTYGCDRTGTLFFMLGALLGVSEAELLKEYELSAFYHSSMSREHRPLYTDLLNAFRELPGETTVEKAEGWARALGLSDSEIESIRQNLLEIPAS